MFGFLRDGAANAADQQQFEGMNIAAEYLIRGLSPYYEEGQNIPEGVVAALKQLESDIGSVTDTSKRKAVYLMGLHRLGEAIGYACGQKALQSAPEGKSVSQPI